MPCVLSAGVHGDMRKRLLRPARLVTRYEMERATQIIVWAVVLVIATLAYWAYSQYFPMD